MENNSPKSASPKISVIIPVYNAEKYLNDCLDSIVNQTLKDIEIICVDDGSTDHSPALLQTYAQKDERFVILRQANAGAGAARNYGMSVARGEYYSILDADDFFEPNMLENAYSAVKTKAADIIVFGSDHYNNMSGEFTPIKYSIKKELLPSKEPFAGVDIQKNIFRAFVGWSWDKLFKASFVKENQLKFQVQRTSNDLLFVFSAVVKADSIVTLNRVLAHHRREVVSLSVTREKSWHCFYDALTALKQQLIDWKLYTRFEQDFENYCVHFSLWNLNTLKEPTYSLLREKLGREWSKELGVLDHPKNYYYEPSDFNKVLGICQAYGEHPSLKDDFVSTKKNLFLRGVDCLKENGIKYTLNNLKDKIRKGKK